MPDEESRRRPSLSTLAIWVAVVAFLAITLGPSLLGLRTFVGIDLIRLSPPYAGAQPLTDPVQSIFVRDNVDGLMPSYSEFHRRLWDGDLASWAPGRSGGTPLAALPSLGLFSPLALPYWVLPTWLAVGFTQLLTVLTAMGGMALFLRRLRCGWPAAWVGGLAFAASGYMIAWVNWPQTRVGAFIPVLFWALERFLQLRTARSAVPVALAVAGLLLGGFPAVAGLTLYAAAAYVLVRLLADRAGFGWAATVRHGLLALGAVVAGLGLAAAQVLPLVRYLGGLDLTYRDEQFFATTPLKYAVTAVFPQAWFANEVGPGSPFSRDLNPVEINGYVGSVVLVLIVLAVLRARPTGMPRGARAFLVGTGVVTSWLIFVQGPLTSWLASVPVFEDNNIGRIRSVLGFAAAALAGLGYDAVVRAVRETRRRPDLRVQVERVALVLGLAGLLVLAYLVDRAQFPVVGQQVRTDVLLAGGAAAVAVGLVLAARWRPAAVAAVVVLPLLVAGQAVAAVQNFWPTGDPDGFYPVTATHRFLMDNTEGYRVAPVADVLLPSSTDVYGLQSIGGHSFLAPTWLDVLEAIDPRTLGTPTIASLDAGQPAYASAPGLDRLAARYYVSADFAAVPGTQRRVDRSDGSTIVLTPGAEVTTALDPTALRGIGVPVVATDRPFDARSRFSVLVTDAAGGVVAQGERTVLRPRATPPRLDVPAVLFLPLAVEGPAAGPGPWTVTVRFDDGPQVQVAGAAGRPELVLVEPADDGLRLMQVADGVAVYERLTALPRIRWAARTEVIADPAQRSAYVAGTRYPDDTAVLSEPGAAAEGQPASVEVVEDSGDTIRVAVRAEGAGYVVVADAIQAGWRAEVDGQPVELVEAEHAGVAVHVPAGAHDVVLNYAPDGRASGGWVSAGSAAALVAVLLAAPLGRLVARNRRSDQRPD